MGRPQIQIDQEQFEELCCLQCTLSEIASWFRCSEDTIERWCKRTYKKTFAETYREKSEGGKISLRRAQFQLAKRYPAMAIFLGKNILGQSDVVKTDVTHDAKSNLLDAIKASFAQEVNLDDIPEAK